MITRKFSRNFCWTFRRIYIQQIHCRWYMENMEPGHSTFIAEIGNYISLKNFTILILYNLQYLHLKQYSVKN